MLRRVESTGRRRRAWVLGLVSVAFALPAPAEELRDQPPLTVVTTGGAFARAKMRTMIRPYREQTGEWVEVLEVADPLQDLERQVESENVTWDVVSMDLPRATLACRSGWLEQVDPASLLPAPDGTPAVEDFLPEAFDACGVGYAIWATVLAYDRASGKEAPTKLADFFDSRRFPGYRGLRREPLVALEWALLADGVKPEKVYQKLETERGVRRAFRMLDRIKDDIVWWFPGSEGPDLVAEGRVRMGSAWNGRVFVQNQQEDRIGVVWDWAVWNMEVWVVPKGSSRVPDALAFIRFATETERLVAGAREIPYGPPRRSAEPLIPPEVSENLPTTHTESHLEVDYEWWATNADRLVPRFEAWINRGPAYDFDDPNRN